MFVGRRPISLLFALPMVTNALLSYCEKENDSKKREQKKGRTKLVDWNNDWDMMSESK